MWEGYLIELLEKLKSTLSNTPAFKDVTFTMYSPEDGFYGGQLDNGQWTGMIGELMHGVGRSYSFLMSPHLH